MVRFCIILTVSVFSHRCGGSVLASMMKSRVCFAKLQWIGGCKAFRRRNFPSCILLDYLLPCGGARVSRRSFLGLFALTAKLPHSTIKHINCQKVAGCHVWSFISDNSFSLDSQAKDSLRCLSDKNRQEILIAVTGVD